MKKKKFLRYTQCFKRYEKELTWDLFVECLKSIWEFCFYYGDKTIDIAFHYENGVKVYEINISSEQPTQHLTFYTVEELISCKVFDNKKYSKHNIWYHVLR